MKWQAVTTSILILTSLEEWIAEGGSSSRELLAFVSTQLLRDESLRRREVVLFSGYDPDEPPFLRAVEISNVLGGQVLAPLLGSVVVEGLPAEDDWDAFWARSDGSITNAQRLTRALENLGPTFVKFGQALGSRPDVVPPSLASALSVLQDDMRPFDTSTAKQIISSELKAQSSVDPKDVDSLVESLSNEPVAAASVGQVYKAVLPNYGDVAVKVQRPGIRTVVERDATLLRSLATWFESIPALPQQQQHGHAERLINTEVVNATEEFMSRVFEELDYHNEASNAATFARLYSKNNGTSPDVRVVVPEILSEFCTDHILVMQWVNGTKLTSVQEDEAAAVAENLSLIEIAIRATLSQLLVSGVLHADPHAGNLLKVRDGNQCTLGYLDFGLLSSVPPEVRDGLVCAVAQLIFAEDVEAVASLFGELQLLPEAVLADEGEHAALTAALEKTMAESLIYPDSNDMGSDETPIPILRFDKLLDALARLVPRFRFQLPPYFINNARALSTLEGIAKSLDPTFNALRVMYPFCLYRILQNPSQSPVVEATLDSLIRSPSSGRVDRRKVKKLLRDSAILTGYRKRRVVWDVLKTRGGQRLVWRIAAEELNQRLAGGRIGRRRKLKRNRDRNAITKSYYKYLRL